MESSPPPPNPTPSSMPSSASRKRAAPSLLPAFEPSSAASSPALPRPAKRQARESLADWDRENAYTKYPSPLPTSTTGILSSSPTRRPVPTATVTATGSTGSTRPGLRRTQSVVSERAPLSAVQSITLSAAGEKLLMGRSSNSSHYQLSANRLISRVHVEARYVPAGTPTEPNKIEIVCKGWNGLQLHCQGQTWELARGDSFTSETEGAEIMLDAQDARVLILWPLVSPLVAKGSFGSASSADSLWDEESPRAASRKGLSETRGLINQSSLIRSPLRQAHRLRSPESPTPQGTSSKSNALSNLLAKESRESLVQVYEDAESDDPEAEAPEMGPSSQLSTQAAASFPGPLQSSPSELSSPENDPDEENDPVIHSFGPFGANIAARMAQVTTEAALDREKAAPAGKVIASTRVHSKHTPEHLHASGDATTSSDETDTPANPAVLNHVINQLAFSRLSSTPISTILNALPGSLKDGISSVGDKKTLTLGELRRLLQRASCIGEIHREGKDAAGKALESEFYYIPDTDTDVQRRAAVVDGLRKPSLRACRKQHKQYYWKRPRTP